jgi:molybdopterin molybdotransferase
MITFDEAKQIVSGFSKEIQTESVGMIDSLGRILAEDVLSDMEMPPFDKSAMDGYACRKAELPGPLKVLEVIPAGVIPTKFIETGCCSKIMTGGRVPEGADCVIKVEETRVTEKGEVVFIAADTYHNICFRAEDVKNGQLVLDKGSLIQPQHIAVMAAVGYTNALVYKKLKAGILITGDELVEPAEHPDGTKIRNSNGWQLIAQCIRAGMEPNYYGIIPDTQDSLLKAIELALTENDIIMLTGGVSMGDFDFVPAMLRKAGVEILFEKIAVQPGSPTLFGKTDNCFVFGLPGNPVSSFVQFELIVRLLTNKLTGGENYSNDIPLRLSRTFTRKKAHRKSFFPVIVDPAGNVTPLDYHGSAHIFSFAGANAIASIEAGCTEITEGSLINVRFI